MEKKYISLNDLEVYQLTKKLSKIAWNIYGKLNFLIKNKNLLAIARRTLIPSELKREGPTKDPPHV